MAKTKRKKAEDFQERLAKMQKKDKSRIKSATSSAGRTKKLYVLCRFFIEKHFLINKTEALHNRLINWLAFQRDKTKEKS